MTGPDDLEDFDPAPIIAALNRHGVHYVVIGALAAQLQGAPIPRTRDIDITPAADKDNVQRLSNALHELSAKIRSADIPEGLPFDHDGVSLSRAGIWNLTTPFGEFDLSFVPSGTQGYDDLARHAQVMEFCGTAVPVADLDDVIRSKEAAGRPKDILHLPVLPADQPPSPSGNVRSKQDIERDAGPDASVSEICYDQKYLMTLEGKRASAQLRLPPLVRSAVGGEIPRLHPNGDQELDERPPTRPC